MAAARALDTSYWPAEPGEVHDTTVCATLRHAATTVSDRLALVTLRAGMARPSLEELTTYLRSEIAPHKTPVCWAFVDEMPATPSGKIQKLLLHNRFEEGTLKFDAVRAASAEPLVR